MPELLPLAHVKARLSELVSRVDGEHDRITITVHGRPAAILISPDDLESLEETLALLSDPEAMRDIAEGEESLKRGDAISMEEMKAELERTRGWKF